MDPNQEASSTINQNIDKIYWWNNPATRRLRLVVLTLLAVAFLSYAYWVGTTSTPTNIPYTSAPTTSIEPTPSSSSEPSGSTPITSTNKVSIKPSTTIEASGGYKLTVKKAFSCQGQAPADWQMQSNSQSNVADLYNPAKTLYAGYGIQAVNTGLVDYAYLYSPPLNNPDLYSSDPATVAKSYANAVISGGLSQTDTSGFNYTDDYNQQIGDYTLRSLESDLYQAVVFFHSQGFPGDGTNYSYALPMYFAITLKNLWGGNGLLVAQVAASIRCTAQYQPRDQYVEASTSSSGSSSGDTNGDEAGYNPQLETEYVHNPNTGENYLVSPSTNWSENGPDGPGYYTQSGSTDYVKLQPGRAN